MAPSVPRKKRKVSLPKNEEVTARIFEKHRSMAAQQPASLLDHQARALCAAYTGVYAAKEPVRTPGDLARLKGVGGWVVDVMEDSFQGPALICPLREVIHQEKRNTLNKPYVPRLKSAAYAIMITLYMEMERGKEFMMRQELIDAAEASGLSQHAIDPNNSRNSWNDGYSYTGWNSMKTLTNKNLVEKKSNPAKYYLTEKGKETARDCLARSGLDGPAGPLTSAGHPVVVLSDAGSDEYDGSSPLHPDEDPTHNHLIWQWRGAVVWISASKSGKLVLHHCPPTVSRKQDHRNWAVEQEKKMWLASSTVPHRGHILESQAATSRGPKWRRKARRPKSIRVVLTENRGSTAMENSSGNRAGSAEKSLLAMPPHQSNDSFLKAYEVVPRSRRKVVDNIRSQFNIPVEIKHLPVGDALWIARHKELDMEYVLDFIVERKNVDDFLGSIKDNRYKDQKLRLKKCGLRKLIYLVEGDVNTVDGSESVKTATTRYDDTENKYGHLTGSIINYYSMNFSAGADTSRLCLTYDEFVKRCSDLEKVTLSDIFALQLMQVPQVTEEDALAVTSLYPTLLSLAKVYTMLEEMLKNKSGMVNAGASKNIFKLIWAEG
ncbi:hypothetical protein CFC21_005697 [Triticum aestivum]|uniref:Crossover junction endonuclease MUS81 n=2 Tax=Triticum aestivum TaxID=4565 RepID=A0A3B5YSZ3_WHEAT|nr:hypothetical protein CFC21_005697 [Triticum aestivum]